jgi:hypothetical protein
MIKKLYLLTGFFALIVILLPGSYVNSVLFSKEISNNTAFVNSTNLDVSNLVYTIDSSPFNVSYADWTEKWWQWSYSIPWDENPSYDDTGRFCGENQSGPVWFLTLSYNHPDTRTCEIPQNTALLITLLNSECSYAEFPSLRTEQELRGCAKQMQDLVVGVNASLDGISLPNLENYRITTDLFNFTLPKSNILNLTSQTTQAVADGNWLFLKPLPLGRHELVAKGDVNSTSTIEIDGNQYDGPVGWNYTITYILNVK